MDKYFTSNFLKLKTIRTGYLCLSLYSDLPVFKYMFMILIINTCNRERKQKKLCVYTGLNPMVTDL